MHTNAKLVFSHLVPKYLRDGMRILEIGPDGFPSTYQGLIPNQDITWHTLDIFANERLTYPLSDPYRFSIPDDSYDMVLAGNVIEHVPEIWRWLPELARVVRPGGYVIIGVPISWPYHEAPVDCWRIYPEGMKALYTFAGLTVLESYWGSLEMPGCRRKIPGRSPERKKAYKRSINAVLGWLGMRIECAYDAVTIGQKKPAAPLPE